MSQEHFTSSDSFDTVDVKGDNIEDGYIENQIKDQAKNYIETQISQGLQGKELQCLIQNISELLQTQDIEKNNLHEKFSLLKDQIRDDCCIEKSNIKFEDALQFFHNAPVLNEIQNILEKEAGLDLTNVLQSYKSFITNDLKLPEKSNILQYEYSQLISNIQQLIINQLILVKNDLLEFKEDNDGNLTNMQWDINSTLKERLSIITESIFPSAIFYLNISQEHVANQLLDKEKAGYKSKLHSGMRLREIREGLIKNTINSGDEVPTGLINNDSFFTLNKVDNQRRDNFLVNNNKVIGKGSTIKSQVKDLQEVTFLNEKDKQIEDEAMVAMLALVGCCCIPYAGATPSVIIDIQDIFSSKDQTIQTLKDMDVIDQSYHTSKQWYDNLLAIVGVLGTLVGLQAAAKSVKLAKILNKIKSSSLPSDKIVRIIQTVGNKLGLPGNDTNQLTQNITSGEKINQAFDNYDHPSTDGEVISHLLSGKTVRLYTAHNTESGTAESMMKNGIYGSRGDEAFFSTMPPVEGEIANSTLYTEVTGKKFYDMRGKHVNDIPNELELIAQGYDGTIGNSTSFLANTNTEVVLFKGRELAGKLHKIDLNSKIPRINQKFEETFKMNNFVYGDKATFTIDQKSTLFNITSRLLDYNIELTEQLLEQSKIDFRNAGFTDKQINTIISLIKKESHRLDIPTSKVYENAGLSDKDRITASLNLLNRNNFSRAEKDAILKAHNVGGYDSGVFRYTQEERILKARILMKEGEFSRNEAENLLDAGLAGKISNVEIKDLQFNNLEIILLRSLGLDINYLLHVNSVEKLNTGIDNITNRQEAEILLQLLDKLPKSFTGEFLKGYEARITNKLDNLKLNISQLQGIIESDFGIRFTEVINQHKGYILALDSIALNKNFFNQVLGINIVDCDKILDAIQAEKLKGSNILLSALMKRFEKVKDMLRSEDYIEIEIDNLEIVRNRFTADIQDRINDVSIKIGKSLTVEQKQVIGEIHNNIDDLYDDLLERDIDINQLGIEEIKTLLNKTPGRENSLRNVGFSDTDINLLINNGII